MHNLFKGVAAKAAAITAALAFTLGGFGFALGSSVPVAHAINAVVTTNAAVNVTATDAILGGTNGLDPATASSFWVSTSTFSTATATMPDGVYSTPDLGAVASSTAFSATLSSVTGLPTITPDTTYYVAAWTNVGGTWYPGAVVSFATVSAPTITTIAPATGSTAGGDLVTVTGTGFLSGATVTVGGVAATHIVVASSTVLTAVTPAGTSGAHDVVVTNNDTGTAILTGGYTYVTPVVTPAPVTLAATNIISTDAVLNGTSGNVVATASSFWVSTSTFSTATATLPDGVYSTPDLGAVASSTAFSATLSSVTGLPTITPDTTYYVAAWTNVGGTWYPGAVRSFVTAAAGTISGTVGTGALAVTSITPVQTNAIADGTYADGWSYLFNITVPTNEPNLSMNFANWINAVAASTLPVAGHMQISSAQALSTSPVTITAANTYATPALDIVGDLSTSTAGKQIQVLVQVAIPTNTANGVYTTSYGVQTLP